MVFSSDLIRYLWVRRGDKPGRMYIVPRVHLETVEARFRREAEQDPTFRWTPHDSLEQAQATVEACRRAHGGAWAAEGPLTEVMDASTHLWADLAPSVGI